MAKRVLVVEDEGITALHLQSALEDAGYEVTFTAMSGEEALEYVEEILPDVVLLDIKLAGELDGIQTGREIRKNHAQIALIYISSYSQQNIRDLAEETNPSGYLVKPITKEALLEAVGKAVAD